MTPMSSGKIVMQVIMGFKPLMRSPGGSASLVASSYLSTLQSFGLWQCSYVGGCGALASPHCCAPFTTSWIKTPPFANSLRITSTPTPAMRITLFSLVLSLLRGSQRFASCFIGKLLKATSSGGKFTFTPFNGWAYAAGCWAGCMQLLTARGTIPDFTSHGSASTLGMCLKSTSPHSLALSPKTSPSPTCTSTIVYKRVVRILSINMMSTAPL